MFIKTNITKMLISRRQANEVAIKLHGGVVRNLPQGRDKADHD